MQKSTSKSDMQESLVNELLKKKERKDYGLC